MEVIRTVAEMVHRAEELRCQGRKLVLVPTMGVLHQGHLALVNAARKHGNHVTVSIFLNPTQFSKGEDLDNYPQDLKEDYSLLEQGGVTNVLFAPTVEELYPLGQDCQSVWIHSEALARHLCGPHRPGHFTGVLTVVMKLYNCCKPHVAIYGLKDAQQFFMLRKLSEDLLTGVKVIGHETVRDLDGLALSSRNVYLSEEERKQSGVLYQSLLSARSALQNGERNVLVIINRMVEVISSAPAARLEYAEIVRTSDLQPVKRLMPGEEIVAAVAVYFGKARLIDNFILSCPEDP